MPVREGVELSGDFRKVLLDLGIVPPDFFTKLALFRIAAPRIAAEPPPSHGQLRHQVVEFSHYALGSIQARLGTVQALICSGVTLIGPAEAAFRRANY